MFCVSINIRKTILILITAGVMKVLKISTAVACEQALLFGQAKRASRERASEGPIQAPRGFTARSHVLATLVSLAQIGELARRLVPQRVEIDT